MLPFTGVMASVPKLTNSLSGSCGHATLCSAASAGLLTDQPPPSMCRCWNPLPAPTPLAEPAGASSAFCSGLPGRLVLPL
eukprot:SAG22_NODE_451_length_10354_cov_5.184983_10_plen_80_part_00